MLRQRENPDSFKAGVLSITVHTILLGALLVSFNWKTTHPVSIAEVELWDSIPAVNMPKPPLPTMEPEPVVKDVPKPEPKPEQVVEAKPQIKPEPKPEPEIAIKQEVPKKLVKKDPPKEPPKKTQQDDQLAKLQKQLMLDALEKPNKPPVDDALKKLQQESLSDGKPLGEQKASAAKAGVVDEFKAKIQAKIRNNVNKSLCGDANLELKFDIALLPTGELGSSPKLTKSSGNPACDEAVERAIRVSEPLPLPEDKALFSQFRALKLTFRPNDH
jgi:colicin import membrane protein